MDLSCFSPQIRELTNNNLLPTSCTYWSLDRIIADRNTCIHTLEFDSFLLLLNPTQTHPASIDNPTLVSTIARLPVRSCNAPIGLLEERPHFADRSFHFERSWQNLRSLQLKLVRLPGITGKKTPNLCRSVVLQVRRYLLHSTTAGATAVKKKTANAAVNIS